MVPKTSEMRRMASLECRGPVIYVWRPPNSWTVPSPQVELRVGGFSKHWELDIIQLSGWVQCQSVYERKSGGNQRFYIEKSDLSINCGVWMSMDAWIEGRYSFRQRTPLSSHLSQITILFFILPKPNILLVCLIFLLIFFFSWWNKSWII